MGTAPVGGKVPGSAFTVRSDMGLCVIPTHHRIDVLSLPGSWCL